MKESVNLMLQKQDKVMDLLQWAKQVVLIKMDSAASDFDLDALDPERFTPEFEIHDDEGDLSSQPESKIVTLFGDTDHPKIIDLAEAERTGGLI